MMYSFTIDNKSHQSEAEDESKRVPTMLQSSNSKQSDQKESGESKDGRQIKEDPERDVLL